MAKIPSLLSGMISGSLAAACFVTSPALAGGTVEFDDGKWVSVGGGLRTNFNSVDVSRSGGFTSMADRGKDFRVESVRLYTSGKIHENIDFVFNTDAATDNDANAQNDIESLVVLDAIVQFHFSDMFNVWVGRHLPPSDRSNLSGPFFINAWNFPVVSFFPAKIAGRDDGISVWGQRDGGKFKYQVGFYEGQENGTTADDSVLAAGRVVLNLWDPEPGYYNASTYYGAKDILAFGLTFQSQADFTGTSPNTGDFSAFNIDGLWEKKLANGAVGTVEGAYYSYGYDNVGTGDQTGYFILGSYLLAERTGLGRLQPLIRYQFLETDGLGGNPSTEREVLDIGVNYIIDGHNARIAFNYQTDETTVGGTTTDDADALVVGFQLQI